MEQDVIIRFMRINPFNANIDVNDNKQLFGFSIKMYFKKIFVSLLLLTNII